MAEKDEKKAAAPKADKAPNPKAEKAAKAKADAAAKAAAPKDREPETKEPARLRKQFDDVIRKQMTEKFAYKNGMEVPRIDKIVLNMGVGEGVNDRKKVELAAADLSALTGQPLVLRAGVENLLDRAYEEPYGAALAPGRNLVLSLEAGFGDRGLR